ncbi:hypothetical protein EU522_01510 [Candidatus Thorarchaeota archaeon]|nr:MAG: hypothetical protein EU522_01510 [Candidatus Thorarchaeota archaeon]
MSEDTPISGPRIPWRFLIPLHAFVALVLLIAVAFSFGEIFPFNTSLGLYRFLPGNILFDLLWVYAITALAAVVVYKKGATLSHWLLKLHQFATRGSYKYHLQNLGPERRKEPKLGRLLPPSLAAMGLAYTLSDASSIADFLFVTESFDTLPPTSAQILVITMPVFFILILLTGVMVLLFLPAWLLEDEGVICERKIAGTRLTVDIEGVGNWHLSLLNGFAMISTLIAYSVIITDIVDWLQTVPSQTELTIWFYLVPMVVIFLAPLIAIAPISIVYIGYELSMYRNQEELENRLEAEGINHVIIEMPVVPDDD